MRYGMVINTSRCIGCDACALACKLNNGTPPGIYWGHVIHEEKGEFPNAKKVYTPLLCMHCKNAPCVKSCPTGASVKNENGIVTVDKDMCMGCRQCVVVCPYQARWFMQKKTEGLHPEVGFSALEEVSYGEFKAGKVSKCNFCMDRVAAGERPSCEQTCPTGARIFGDLDDPDSEVSKLIRSKNPQPLGAEYGTEPSVYYIR